MEKRKIERIEIKMFQIRSPFVYGGMSADLDEVVWVEPQVWESDEKCKALLRASKRKAKNVHAATPELYVYWEICEEKIEKI